MEKQCRLYPSPARSCPIRAHLLRRLPSCRASCDDASWLRLSWQLRKAPACFRTMGICLRQGTDRGLRKGLTGSSAAEKKSGGSSGGHRAVKEGASGFV